MILMLFAFCDGIVAIAVIAIMIYSRKRTKNKVTNTLNELYCIKDKENCSLSRDTNVIIIEKI